MKTKKENSLSPKVTDNQRNDNLWRLSMEVSKSDLDNAVKDTFGVLYSKDGKSLLSCENDGLTVTLSKGLKTKIELLTIKFKHYERNRN